MKKYPFYAALEHASEMYGVELNEDQFETYGMSAWQKIGNKDYKMYLTKMCLECDPNGGWYVDKPCNLDAIEAITLNYESAQETSPVDNYHGAYTHPIEQNIEGSKQMPNELYIPGKFVKYKELGDRIYFTEPYPEVNILYKGLYTDEDGLPYLSNKEVEAIAAYCAFVDHYKHGIQQKNQQDIAIAQMLRKDWQKLCDAARIPESISQNSMNEIMNVFVRRDIHRFGQTYKPIL